MDAQAEGERDQDQDQRLHDDREHIAQGASQQQRDAAHGRHSQPLDHARPQLGDQAEADPGSAEHAELYQQARHEDVVGPTWWEPLHRCDGLEQGCEEDEIDHGLQHTERNPGRVADEESEVAAEDESRIARQLHAAVSRNERPVWRMKTSSRLGRCRPMVTSVKPAPSSSLRMAGIATSPRSTYRRTDPSSSLASLTTVCSLTTSRARGRSPATVSVTTSPATARFSSSGVPSATIFP